MDTGLKIFWALILAAFVAVCAMPFLGMGGKTILPGKGKTEPVLIAILGKNNKVFIVCDGSKKGSAGMALAGNNETKTVVVNNGPLSLSFRGDHNRVMIDNEIRRQVTVQNIGSGNVYVFSD
jgi:hypothetical protein